MSLLIILLVCRLHISCLFQQSQATLLKIPVVILIEADGKLVNEKTGLSVHAKTLRFKGLLQRDSRYIDFKNEIIIQETTISIARGGRVLTQMLWKPDLNLENIIGHAESGNRLVMYFTVAAQCQGGEIIPIDYTIVKNLTLH